MHHNHWKLLSSIAVMCAGAANGGLLLAVGCQVTNSDWLLTGNIATLHIARNEKWVVVHKLLAIVTKLEVKDY